MCISVPLKLNKTLNFFRYFDLFLKLKKEDILAVKVLVLD